jgi:hypothetical protein
MKLELSDEHQIPSGGVSGAPPDAPPSLRRLLDGLRPVGRRWERTTTRAVPDVAVADG